MRNLIYLSPVPWASFAQRPHKFINWFRKKYQGKVLWIEPYPTRLPQRADLGRGRIETKHSTTIEVPDWLTIIFPKNLPIEPLPGSGMANIFLWRTTLMNAVKFAQNGKCALVVGKPSVFAIQLMKALPQCKSVYDAMDDFPAFYSGFSHLAMKRREENIVSLVGEVWTSSTLLYEKWSGKHNDVRLVFNGLDVDVIKPLSSISMSTTVGRMVYGYLGTVGNWFDWEMIFALARNIPDDLVRIIGPVYKPAHAPLPSNVETLPPCEHSQAMIEMAKFDVGLIPFLRTALTDSVDPIKYYEYRAIGIPIISTAFGEMRYRDDVDDVYLIRDEASLERVVRCVREEIKAKQLDLNFIRLNSWAARFDQVNL